MARKGGATLDGEHAEPRPPKMISCRKPRRPCADDQDIDLVKGLGRRLHLVPVSLRRPVVLHFRQDLTDLTLTCQYRSLTSSLNERIEVT